MIGAGIFVFAGAGRATRYRLASAWMLIENRPEEFHGGAATSVSRAMPRSELVPTMLGRTHPLFGFHAAAAHVE